MRTSAHFGWPIEGQGDTRRDFPTRIDGPRTDGIDSAVFQSAPPGILAPYAGAAAPTGWLICDGAAVSRTTYAALFAAIGVAYGVGDGSTTFNLPNLKGRMPAGLDTGQTEFNTLGKTGGVKTHSHDLNTGMARVTVATGSPAQLSLTRITSPSWTASHVGPLGGTVGGGAAQTTGAQLIGSSEVVAALPPYVTMPYIIKT